MKPARQEAYKDAIIVSDLDKLIAKTVGFVWNGKTHYIRPISVVEFLATSEALAKMDRLQKEKKVTFDEIVDAYEQLITSVCDSITRADILKMTQAQVGALVNLVIQTVTGKVHADEKKKEQTNYPA